MPSELELFVKGNGTRKQLSDALRLLCEVLYSENMEEIYNINGSSYNDYCVEVTLKDKDE